jgi:hypothetical protein
MHQLDDLAGWDEGPRSHLPPTVVRVKRSTERVQQLGVDRAADQ